MATSAVQGARVGGLVIKDPVQLRRAIEDAVGNVKIEDIHTHIFPPAFGGMSLWGIDDLLTYHYLQAEYLGVSREDPQKFLSRSKEQQADRVWNALFNRRAPISEATTGVVTCLSALGLDPFQPDLKKHREFFRDTTLKDHIERVFKLAGVGSVVMTNDPFNKEEASVWMKGFERDPRFRAALRIDALFDRRKDAVEEMKRQGYHFSGQVVISHVKTFLERWADRMKPVYLAASLPDTFAYPDRPDNQIRTQVLDEAVLPLARERNIPVALMIGVKRGTNPGLKLAGDSLGKADIKAVEELCRKNPENKFLVTMLSRENQHELAVTARKFPNLMVFGCWWFLNNPSIIEEMTRERIELLGLNFIPQHSDARILDQLTYKWIHSRRAIAAALAPYYERLMRSHWRVTKNDVQKSVQQLFSLNFMDFLKWRPGSDTEPVELSSSAAVKGAGGKKEGGKGKSPEAVPSGMKGDVAKKVKKILAEELGLSDAQIKKMGKRSKLIEDLGADSLDEAALVQAFKEEFDIEIDDQVEFRTVGNVIDEVNKALKRKGHKK